MMTGQFVGINTTDPQATLHIAGDLKFVPDNTVTSTRLIGANSSGDIIEFPLVNGFQIVDNTLTLASSEIKNLIKVGTYDQSPLAPTISSWDNFDLGLVDSNASNSVIRIIGETGSYHVTGFQGGQHGRILYYYNAQQHNVTFKNLDSLSDPENQIITGAIGDESIVAEGMAEFLYDGSVQKWVLINIRT